MRYLLKAILSSGSCRWTEMGWWQYRVLTRWPDADRRLHNRTVIVLMWPHAIPMRPDHAALSAATISTSQPTATTLARSTTTFIETKLPTTDRFHFSPFFIAITKNVSSDTLTMFFFFAPVLIVLLFVNTSIIIIYLVNFNMVLP